jgi:hypothetical protein
MSKMGSHDPFGHLKHKLWPNLRGSIGHRNFHIIFHQRSLEKDVQHVNLLCKMGDVQMGFGILIFCLV